MNRREFLKGTAWMGAAAFAAGCQLNRFGFGEGGQMQDYVYRKLMGRRIRVGFIGIGGRGTGAVHRRRRAEKAISRSDEERACAHLDEITSVHVLFSLISGGTSAGR